MLAVRLNENLENELSYFSKLNKLTKTDVVKEALELYFKSKREETKKTPFELGKDLFGSYESGQSDLSLTYKERLKKKLNAKYSSNR